jgi:hypothetical protein
LPVRKVWPDYVHCCNFIGAMYSRQYAIPPDLLNIVRPLT